MTAVIFEELSKTLRAAGFSEEQASTLAKVIEENVSGIPSQVLSVRHFHHRLEF